MSDARDLTMSAKELDRLEIISRVVERRLTQQRAADQMGLLIEKIENKRRTKRLAQADAKNARRERRALKRPQGLRQWTPMCDLHPRKLPCPS